MHTICCFQNWIELQVQSIYVWCGHVHTHAASYLRFSLEALVAHSTLNVIDQLFVHSQPWCNMRKKTNSPMSILHHCCHYTAKPIRNALQRRLHHPFPVFPCMNHWQKKLAAQRFPACSSHLRQQGECPARCCCRKANGELLSKFTTDSNSIEVSKAIQTFKLCNSCPGDLLRKTWCNQHPLISRQNAWVGLVAELWLCWIAIVHKCKIMTVTVRNYMYIYVQYDS